MLQTLATEGATVRSSGELPWRTAFGTPLQLLRHHRNDLALAELGRVYIRDALRRWVPDAEVASVLAERNRAAATLRVRFVAAGEARQVDVPLGAP